MGETAGSAEAYLESVLAHFGADLTGLRVALDCANGAYSGLASRAFERLGASVEAIGNEPDGDNINVGCGATDTAALQALVAGGGFDLGIAFDGDGIVAILALELDVDLVAVTQMTNHGFHRLMDEHGIRVVVTDVGDRYVLEALWREAGVLGGEQSGHVICLRDHVTGDGLAAALLLCGALRDRTLGEAAALMPRFAQAKANIRVASRELTSPILTAVERTNVELGSGGRVLVRPSGTEPLMRVLVEAEDGEVAENACASIAELVERELG